MSIFFVKIIGKKNEETELVQKISSKISGKNNILLKNCGPGKFWVKENFWSGKIFNQPIFLVGESFFVSKHFW